MQIEYVATLNSGATEWYGQLAITGIRYEDGSAVQVESYLAMTFNSPAPIADTDITIAYGTTWVGSTVSVENVSLDTNLYSVTLTITFDSSHTMDAADTITIGVNGDLTTDTDTYLQSFVIAADQSPAVNGTVTVSCAVAPDEALSAILPVIDFVRGSQSTPLTLTYGDSTSVSLQQGDYTVRGDDLATSDLTVSAPLVITPDALTVAVDSTNTVKVTFGPVERSAALDIAIDKLTGLDSETLHVTVVEKASGETLASFDSPTGKTTQLRNLPASGTAQFKIDHILLNNTDYSFNVADVTLANTLQTVSISDKQVVKTKVDTTGFAQVPIDVTTDTTLPQQVTVRLASDAMNYTQTVDVETYQTAFSVAVKPGTYAASAESFLSSGTVYAVNVPGQLTVDGSASGSLNVSIQASANLNVKGFPSFLSFGSISNLVQTNADDLAAARACSVFTYAGVDGAGDSGTYLDDDTQTRALISLARQVEAKLNGQPVLPIPISYTCNLSLGDTPTILADASAHAHSFGNYILALTIANANIDDTHPVPAGFIVNPDFLGATEQGHYPPTYSMPVRDPLQQALDYRNIEATIPENITEDIKGYVAAVNWLTRTVAPSVPFGWQINLWGVGYSEWIYDTSDPASWAQTTADYVSSLAVFSGDNKPDFLAIDRYEADDYTQRAYLNGYCYGPLEWSRYFDFCEGVSRALKVPVMPWQIPASRTPNTTDEVNSNFDSQHWGTGGSCILGDAEIGSDYHNVHPTILALQFSPAFPMMGATVEDMYIRSEPFDISAPMYPNFPLRGIFAVLLGGGSTTGLVASTGNPEPWPRDKIAAYMNDPITFGDVSTRRCNS